MVMESKEHKELKQLAKQSLLNRGFVEAEIVEEHKILHENTLYIIDVAGVKDDKTVFIECGYVNHKKHSIVRKLCDEFIHFPYKKQQTSHKMKVTMTFDEDVYLKFKSECRKNGLKVSTTINKLMKRRLKNKKFV